MRQGRKRGTRGGGARGEGVVRQMAPMLLRLHDPLRDKGAMYDARARGGAGCSGRGTTLCMMCGKEAEVGSVYD